MTYRLGELAHRFGCELHGDEDIEITSVCTLQSGNDAAISFLANSKYYPYLKNTQAAAVILKPEDVERCPVAALAHINPYACYARIAQLLASSEPQGSQPVGIDPTAVVHPTASLGNNTSLAPLCVIEDNVTIGDDCFIGSGVVVSSGVSIGSGSYLYPNVTIYHDCIIGENAILHSGVVVGADGFGIAQDDGEWVKVPQIGRVVIGDNVEVGASTTIDRGAIEDTVIDDGVKLDNQIQVGHNVYIGKHSAVAGCVGIAGSAKIGERCTIGAMTLVLGHLELADDVHITAQSMVTSSIGESGVYSSGTPLQPNKIWRRNFTRFGQLDDLAKRIKKLERQLLLIGDTNQSDED